MIIRKRCLSPNFPPFAGMYCFFKKIKIKIRGAGHQNCQVALLIYLCSLRPSYLNYWITVERSLNFNCIHINKIEKKLNCTVEIKNNFYQAVNVPFNAVKFEVHFHLEVYTNWQQSMNICKSVNLRHVVLGYFSVSVKPCCSVTQSCNTLVWTLRCWMFRAPLCCRGRCLTARWRCWTAVVTLWLLSDREKPPNSSRTSCLSRQSAMAT